MLVVMIITVVNWWLCDGDSGTNHWTHCSTSDTCRILVILCSRCCVSESCSDNCKSVVVGVLIGVITVVVALE